MRLVISLLLLVIAACELEGPEDKRHDFETYAQAEARHAAESAAPTAKPEGRATKPAEQPPLAPGETKLDAHRDGDAVVIDYRGWLPCDGNFEMRPAGSGTLAIVDKNTSKERASCVGPTELHARIPNTPQTTTIRVDQGKGYGEITATIQ